MGRLADSPACQRTAQLRFHRSGGSSFAQRLPHVTRDRATAFVTRCAAGVRSSNASVLRDTDESITWFHPPCALQRMGGKHFALSSNAR